MSVLGAKRGPYKIKSIEQKFAERWKADANGCHIWQSTINCNGYGVILTGNVETGRKQMLAHRLGWELKNGPIPEGLYCCHKCDIRLCVNPDHIFLGTLADNVADMVAKGRHKSGRLEGADHGRAILTDNKVLAIREDYRNGMVNKDMATKYGMSMSAVNKAARGISWKHLKED